MSLMQTWGPFFQDQVRRRGRALVAEAAVREFAAPDAGRLGARVGDNGEGQTVSIEIVEDRAEASCSCERFAAGTFCEHVWALLLTAHRQSLEGESHAVVHELGAVRPTLPRASRRTARPRPERRSEPDWAGRLVLLRPSDSEEASDAEALPEHRQLGYIVDPGLSARHDGLVIDVRERQVTGNGWGRYKPIRISEAAVTEISDPVDREIMALMLGADPVDARQAPGRGSETRSPSTVRLHRGAWRAMLRRVIETGRAFMESGTAELVPLWWAGEEAWRLWAVGELLESGELELDLELRRLGRRVPLAAPELVLGGTDGLVIHEGWVAPLDDLDAGAWITQFRRRPGGRGGDPIRVAAEDIPDFLRRLWLLPRLPEIDLPEGLGPEEARLTPAPRIDLVTAGARQSALVGEVTFAYGPYEVMAGQPGRFLSEGRVMDEAEAAGEETAGEGAEEGAPEPLAPEGSPEHTLVRRDIRREREHLATLMSEGLRPETGRDPGDAGHRFRLAADALPEVAGRLTAAGWVVRVDGRLLRETSTPTFSIESGIDWFELHGGFEVETAHGRESLDLPRLLEALKANQGFVELSDGTEAIVPRAWLESHRLIGHLGEAAGDHLRFQKSQGLLLDQMLEGEAEVTMDEGFTTLRHQLIDFEHIEPAEPPATFEGTLRAYQRQGLGWLHFLRRMGIGGILADDMGLGKTVQVLALLEAARNEGTGRPSLIVVPRSVLHNWIEEAERFVPRLRIEAYSGPERAALRERFGAYDVLVTTYGTLRRDIEHLAAEPFEYAVLDEAQAIKNPRSQTARAIRRVTAAHRLALTGTPVENHLGDLWSIFEFLNPGVLGSGTRFADLVSGAGRDPAAREAAGQSARALRPFILRRTKGQVLAELPPKTEQTIYCQMPARQAQLYEELLSHYRGSLMPQVAERGGSGATMMVLEALLRLRQAACHPGLIDPRRMDEPSAKLDELADRIEEMVDEGHKALVFSQFTSMLAIVRRRLETAGVTYEYLDGQTRDRKRRVDRFQEDPDCPVFLISLKAGGLGLNLTAADYVFILDPWWNPAVEQQAIDRAHRIGQERHVFAYRLICQDTIEQRIAELQERKNELVEAIVGEQQNLLAELTREDLEWLFE